MKSQKSHVEKEKYYQLFGKLKEEVARSTKPLVTFLFLDTVLYGQHDAIRCTLVPTLRRRKYLIMLLPLISPQSCDDGGGGGDDVLNDDP